MAEDEVDDRDPLQQGLKQTVERPPRELEQHVDDRDPLQQGLKHCR